MKMNRRNVLVGLGALGIGGGALLGSGAFTSVEAQREVQVNVVTGPDISDEWVDVRIDAGGYDTVFVERDDGEDNPAEMFPENEDEVSLIDNDVTIIFGDDNDGLPPNSRVTYNSLFRVIRDGEEPLDIQLELDEDDWLEFDGDATWTDTVSDTSIDLEGAVITGDDGDNDVLVITIQAEGELTS